MAWARAKARAVHSMANAMDAESGGTGLHSAPRPMPRKEKVRAREKIPGAGPSPTRREMVKGKDVSHPEKAKDGMAPDGMVPDGMEHTDCRIKDGTMHPA